METNAKDVKKKVGTKTHHFYDISLRKNREREMVDCTITRSYTVKRQADSLATALGIIGKAVSRMSTGSMLTVEVDPDENVELISNLLGTLPNAKSIRIQLPKGTDRGFLSIDPTWLYGSCTR